MTAKSDKLCKKDATENKTKLNKTQLCIYDAILNK